MTLQQLYNGVRDRALQYPETCEESPWGDRVVKVCNKIFGFHALTDETLTLGFRLPHSGFTVLASPFAAPTGYGLARTGWVTLTFTSPKQVSPAQLDRWIDESYRTVAPRRIVKELPPQGPPPKSTATASRLPPIRMRMAVASDDSLRIERTVTVARNHGVEIIPVGGPCPEALAAMMTAKPSTLIVDLGRRHTAGIEFAKVAQDMLPGLRIALAGVRDAAMQRKVDAELPHAHTSRLPPGDPKFVEGLTT